MLGNIKNKTTANSFKNKANQFGEVKCLGIFLFLKIFSAQFVSFSMFIN